MMKDGAPPTNATNDELSRIKDALQALEGTPHKMTLWYALPHAVRMDFNYAKWRYVAPSAR